MLGYIINTDTVSFKSKSDEYDNWGMAKEGFTVSYPSRVRENISLEAILGDKGDSIIYNYTISINGMPCINIGDTAFINDKGYRVKKLAYTKDLSGAILFTKIYV